MRMPETIVVGGPVTKEVYIRADKVLEIIDTIDAECDKDVLAGNSVDLDEVFARLHNGVLALKGEQ